MNESIPIGLIVDAIARQSIEECNDERSELIWFDLMVLKSNLENTTKINFVTMEFDSIWPSMKIEWKRDRAAKLVVIAAPDLRD